jgi:P-type Cu+ transporter
MSVDRFKTPHRSDYAGRTMYFCGAGCKEKFDREPERYSDPSRRREAALAHAGEGEARTS